LGNKIIYFLFISTIHENIIDIDDHNESRTKKETWIKVWQSQALLDQTLSEILIDILWQLTKPIESAPKAKDLCTLTSFETMRLVDIDLTQ